MNVAKCLLLSLVNGKSQPLLAYESAGSMVAAPSKYKKILFVLRSLNWAALTKVEV